MSEQKESVRVVVTGLGAITAQGPSVNNFWENVRDGKVAIRPVERVPMEGFRTRIAGEVKERALPKRDYRRPADFRDPVFDFAMKAAEEAMEGCGCLNVVPPERWGVVIGTCNAGLISGEEWYLRNMRGEPADPQLVLLVPPQAIAEALCGAFGLKGPAVSIDTACAAGANAIGFAADLIRSGHADAVLTGGSDALSDILIAGFNSLESLSPNPAAPYSRDRTGLSLGEGSGMVVLVREDIARKAGLHMYAEVAGYGLSADGYHATAPHPEGIGAARAIRTALRMGGVSPDQVRYVNSHGTGTAKNDPAETRATRVGLGDAANRVAVSSTKSMVGHLLGAAGAVEGIITIKALEQQIAPPTANFTEPDPECDLDYVPNTARPLQMDYAISNNFAFGGANACVAFARVGARQSGPPCPSYDRAVITGLSALTSGGCSLDEVWNTYASERPAVQTEDGVKIGRVDLDPSAYLSPRDRRRMDRLGIFAVVAAHMALADAGVEVTDANKERIGCMFATGIGPMESMENFTRPLLEEGPAAANPAVFPNTVYNAAAGQVAMNVKIIGPTSTVTASHAAGASSLSYCYDLIACDHADVMLSVAADTLTDTVIRAYRDIGTLAPGGNFSLAEAGVGLTVERLGAAKARGAKIYGEILGYGLTSDALGVGQSDPEGRGLERAMRIALERAGLSAGDLAAIWANALGIEDVDAAEAQAIQRIFGGQVRVITPKRLFGEPIGAGASLSAALALTGWRRGDASLSPSGPILINSCSLGGTNFSLVLAPYRA